MRSLADLLGAIAWPLVVLIAVILLRHEIAGLMHRQITLKKGDTSIQIEAAAASRRIEEVASALAEPDSGSGNRGAEDRQALIQELVNAAADLGWTSAATDHAGPPRPKLNWTEQGAKILRGDLASREGWEMAKARLAITIQDGFESGELTPEDATKLTEVVKQAHERALRDASL